MGLSIYKESEYRTASYTTVFPRSSDPIYTYIVFIVGYYIKWVTTSWTLSNCWYCVIFIWNMLH